LRVAKPNAFLWVLRDAHPTEASTQST